MELYKELTALRCFSRQDMVRLTGSEANAAWQIRNYLKKGYIERVRRDLYAVISLETEQAIPNRFQIASKASEDACVSHHSAFEFYGYGNQVFYNVYFTTGKRLRAFSYDGINYCPVIGNTRLGITENAEVRVTSLERTVIDGIADFEKIGGLEELLRCLILVPSLNGDKLLEILEAYNFGQLYQKAGYILEAFKEELSLSDAFFAECERKSSASKTYLYKRQDGFTLHARWKLYAPEDLKSAVSKGITDYDAV